MKRLELFWLRSLEFRSISFFSFSYRVVTVELDEHFSTRGDKTVCTRNRGLGYGMLWVLVSRD